MNITLGVAMFVGVLVALYLIGAALTLAFEWAGW
jgi:hypothetical protein